MSETGGRARKVPLAGRLLDLVAALVFLPGAAISVRAHLGMRALEANPPVSEAGAFAAMARFDHLWRLSRVGMALMLAGGAIALAAAVVGRLLRRRETTERPDTGDARP